MRNAGVIPNIHQIEKSKKDFQEMVKQMREAAAEATELDVLKIAEIKANEVTDRMRDGIKRMLEENFIMKLNALEERVKRLEEANEDLSSGTD